MKKIVSIAILALMSLSVFAQNSAYEKSKTTIEDYSDQSKPKGAQIKFDKEVIDYGVIQKGANGVRVFEFTNTGDEPLIISTVYSSCGCTVPKKPEAPIMPGERGEIEVKYDTKRVGPIRKTISVYTNADKVPFPLKIKGSIIPAEDSEFE